MVSFFQGIPLVLRWCSVGILGCSSGVPSGFPLFRPCSGVFRCFAGAPCSVVPCSGVPGFIVCCQFPATLYFICKYAFIVLSGISKDKDIVKL